MAVIVDVSDYARVFASAIHFQPRLKFVGTAKSLPWEWSPVRNYGHWIGEVVEHSPHYPEVKGLRPGSGTGTGREKITKNGKWLHLNYMLPHF
jgi:hypothetical protein